MSKPRVIVDTFQLISSLGNCLNSSVSNLIKNSTNIKKTSEIINPNFKPEEYLRDFWLCPIDFISSKELQSSCPIFLRNRSLGMINHVFKLLETGDINLQDRLSQVPPEKLGLALSCLSTNQTFMYNNLKKHFESKTMDRFTMLNTLTNANGTFLTQKYKIKGPFLTNSNACAAGTSAFIDAFKSLILNEAESFLVVAGEECDSPINLNGCYRFRAMNDGQESYQCLPFDTKRSGIMLGEGAGVALLHRVSSSSEFNKIKGESKKVFEMLSYGVTTDGFHVVQTEPNGEGAFRAMKKACEGFESEIHKEGYLVVNCHAAGTQVGDLSELKALARLADHLQVR